MEAQAMQMRQPQQQQQYEEQAPQEIQGYEEQGYPIEEQQYPQQPQAQPQQQMQVPQQVQGQFYTAEQVAQMMQQQRQGLAKDNILMAKNVFSAENAQATGNNSILNAPNIMKGEMISSRNTVEVGQGPVSNVQGNSYTDINPMNGQPIIKRRVTERWATSEAL